MSIPRTVFGIALACGLAAAQAPLSGNVYDGHGGPLLAGTVYHVTSTVIVPSGQVLTVQPGAVVKVHHDYLLVDGTLAVSATAGQPATFTSLFDDAAGGDTNGDGTATTPAPGDWYGIQLRTGSAIQGSYGVLRYHGYGSWSGLYVTSSSSSLDLAHWLFADGATSGLGLNGLRPALALVDCAFEGNALYAVMDATLDGVPGISGGSATGNGYDAIRVVNGNVLKDTHITGANCLGGALWLGSTVVVPAGVTLTLGDGAILKTWRDYLVVDGSLVLDGAPGQPVVLTSLRDDAWGGDTNGDGAATPADVADWYGIEPRAGATLTMDHALLRYHGYGGWSGVTVGSGSATLALTDSTIEIGAESAIDLNGYRPALSVTGCTFRDNMDYAVRDAAIDSVPGFQGNTAGNNLVDAILVIDATLQTDVVLGGDNCLGGALVLGNTCVVPPGRRLELRDGAVVKLLKDYVVVDGTLHLGGTDAQPVYVTSFHDDEAGGDTDVSGPPPAACDWYGIEARAGSTVTMDAAVVRYYGYGGWAGLEVVAASATLGLNGSTISDGCQAAIDLNGVRPAISIDGCRFTDNAGWAIDNAAIDSVAGFNGNVASGNGHDAVRILDANPAADTILTSDNGLGGALYVASTSVIGAGTTLTLEPGVVLKFFHGYLVAFGGLVVNGTPESPVVFTSYRDDAWGGDTNGDGAASAPAKGDWYGLDIRPGATASQLGQLLARFTGYGSWAGLRVDNAALVARGVRVEHSASDGFNVLGADELADLAAFDCANGVWLAGGDAFVHHVSVAQGTGTGIRALDGFAGRVESSVAWGNAAGDWLIAPAVPVSWSDGTGVPAGPGNFTYDPLFVDAPGGDLRMQSASPCIDRGDPDDVAGGRDMAGFPRAMDGDLDGLKRLDMGAYEYDNLELSLSGDPLPGGLLEITATAHAAFADAWLLVGLGFAEQDARRFGTLFVDLAGPYGLLYWPTVPGPVPVDIPASLPPGSSFVLQLAARVTQAPTSPGNLSNPAFLAIE